MAAGKRSPPCTSTRPSRASVKFRFPASFGKIKQPAHVVLISERLLTPEEREAKAKRDSFARALCESYHYVVDVDLGTGHFELLANRNGLATDASGDYTTHFGQFLDHVLPQYREAFRERFSLEGLQASFAADVNDRNIHLEYQFAEEAGPRWRSRIAFAYTQDDGSRHVLQCIRDINEQKCAEFTHRQDEENLQVALQNSYAKIYRMDLAANQLTCLFCNTELLAPIDVSGEFDKDIITVMKTRVHPRDRVIFLNFFTAESILRKLDAGEELSAEYRKLGLDGTYHWMLALIVPLPTGNRGEVVLLVRDVTESKEQQDKIKDIGGFVGGHLRDAAARPATSQPASCSPSTWTSLRPSSGTISSTTWRSTTPWRSTPHISTPRRSPATV